MIRSVATDLTTEPQAALVDYLLAHGDDNLVLAQRLGEWSSRAPDLEEDIALTNIALDHLGQARSLLSYAGEVEGAGRDEDALAFHRAEREFRNVLLVEQPNGHFGHTMVRQLLFDTYQLSLWEVLSDSADTTLAGISAKALKEARYHQRHSAMWVVRLGDGTELSHTRTQAAVDDLWRFTGELFAPVPGQDVLHAAGIAPDPTVWKPAWDERVGHVFAAARLERPDDQFQRNGGRAGLHTEHMGFLLADLQYLQRAYPGLEW